MKVERGLYGDNFSSLGIIAITAQNGGIKYLHVLRVLY